MCGRYVSARSVDVLADDLDVADVDAALRADHRPDWNVAPTAAVPAVVGDALVRMTWGLGVPAAGRTRLVINARVETVRKRPLFADAVEAHRCLLPADGYYEWTAVEGGKQPWFLAPPDGSLLLMAGIYWDGPDGRRVVVLTGGADGELAGLHARTPMVVGRGDREVWLRGPASDALAGLRPATATGVVATAVSPEVNSVANNHAGLLSPVAVPTQAALF